MKAALLIAALLAQTQNILGLRAQNERLDDLREVGADEPSWVLVAGWAILDHRARTGDLPEGSAMSSFWLERAMTVLRESDREAAAVVDAVLDRQKAGGSADIPEVASLWTRLLAQVTAQRPKSVKAITVEAILLGARPPALP